MISNFIRASPTGSNPHSYAPSFSTLLFLPLIIKLTDIYPTTIRRSYPLLLSKSTGIPKYFLKILKFVFSMFFIYIPYKYTCILTVTLYILQLFTVMPLAMLIPKPKVMIMVLQRHGKKRQQRHGKKRQ